MANEEMMLYPVKTWYTETFEDDPAGYDLPDTLGEANCPFFAPDIEAAPEVYRDKPITFQDYFDILDGYGDVYSLMGNGADSLVRERIFAQMADIMGVDYDYIYDQWLRGAGN